jgi:phosphoribosylaminoimidazolecarboxamide formyltransferase/IMP cyclohydrolase
VRALISVYDKSGVAEFARRLAELGFEIVASGGTAAELEASSVPVTRTETLTGFGDMLGHRVVTLHPAIHGGILARPDTAEDAADLEGHGIEPFDLVCVNLYPFAGNESAEMIDIGGPALLRGAAKNFEHVAAVSSPGQYEAVLDELRAGGLSPETRRRLAAEAFATTAAYEASIAAWFDPDRLTLSLPKALELAYGENPHQRAAFYGDASSVGEQLHGKPLSYNNLNDLAAARALLDDLDGPACVIVKHANPCGVAVAESIEAAYEGALAADPVSAFGGVVALNRPVSAGLGARLAEQFVEVLSAPGYQPAALEAVTAKPNVRVLVSSEAVAASTDVRSALGGLLVQEPDAAADEREAMEVVCGEPSEDEWADILFAWTICKHVTSNAIALARGGRTIGIGAGQMSRVDAVRIALDKARKLGHDVAGSTLASDAFFPFADGAHLALDAGVRAIVQPGGSKRDAEVVEAVREAGAAMVFTGRRHFRH